MIRRDNDYKMRLDKYLLEHHYFTSREKAQIAIAHRTVKVNGLLTTKASKEIDASMNVEIVDIFNRFVSMGGLKLEKAIRDFSLDFNDKQVLDIGASTGGFTDCALQYGASHVVAVDVGTQQLTEPLRHHTAVTSIENTDFRNLTPEMVHHKRFDFIVADVSFISLTCLLPCCTPFLKDDGSLVLLIKPQFEAGRSFLNRSGIVTDEKGYQVAINRVVGEALNQQYFLNGLTLSTLFELHKNVEFLSLFSRHPNRYKFRFPQLCREIKDLKKNLQ